MEQLGKENPCDGGRVCDSGDRMAKGLLEGMEKWADNVCQRNMSANRINPHSRDNYL